MVTIGNWTDNPCYYVDCVNGKQVALLLGPFIKKEDADNWLEPARDYANGQYPESHFYSFGTCKMETGHRDGKFNNHFSPDGWDGTGDNLSEV